MPRTMRDRAQDWRWWGEQALHMTVIGAPPPAILLGAWASQAAAWPVWGGALAALWIAGVREWEQRPVASWGDLVVDVLATGLGGALVGVGYWVA